jgi:hypothetical protein
MAYTPGPKELAQKALRENKIRNGPKPSKADLRSKIAKVKPMTNKGGRRGR